MGRCVVVQHVLERERMNGKTLGQLAQERDVAEAIDIDPVHLRGIEARVQFVEGRHLGLENRVGVY